MEPEKPARLAPYKIGQINGGMDVVAIFGDNHSFHDGEILSFDLKTSGCSRLTVLSSTYGEEKNSDGSQKPNKTAETTFNIFNIVYLELYGFSSKNIVGSIDVYACCMRRANKSIEDLTEIEIFPSYGISGNIYCKKLSIETKIII